MTDMPDDYWCAVPELKELNMTVDEIRALTIPFEKVSSIISIVPVNDHWKGIVTTHTILILELCN